MLSLKLARLYRKPAHSVRPIVMLAAAITVSSAALAQEKAGAVAIRPAPANAEQVRKPLSYREAYDSIPFSRAEYTANPSYRHEAAMELVFGVQRPTTVVKLPAIGPQPLTPSIEQNFFMGLYPSSWALRLGQSY
jgi:hypothetical protein